MQFYNFHSIRLWWKSNNLTRISAIFIIFEFNNLFSEFLTEQIRWRFVFLEFFDNLLRKEYKMKKDISHTGRKLIYFTKCSNLFLNMMKLQKKTKIKKGKKTFLGFQKVIFEEKMSKNHISEMYIYGLKVCIFSSKLFKFIHQDALFFSKNIISKNITFSLKYANMLLVRINIS